MIKNFNLWKKQNGFTLIELLIAIAIIGILSSLLFSNFVGIRERSRDGARKSDLRQIQASLELYRSDQGEYPSALPACGSKFTDKAPETTDYAVVYMQKIPCDQSGGNVSYTYAPGTDRTTYILVACLENKNDNQKDPAVNDACASTTNVSYTLQNP